MHPWREILSLIGSPSTQTIVTLAGLACLGLVPVGAAWALLDRRLVHRERVAFKPTRFALSIGVYLLTVSWMLGYVRPDRLASLIVHGAVWGLLAGATVELACITLQAARGRGSHFNYATALDAGISALMGVVAILFVGMLLPLAWEIAWRPRPDATPLMTWAIVGGLVLTFGLGTLTGVGMGRPSSAGDDLLVPLTRWRIRRGTLRAAHFLGVHAMQAMPLAAAGALRLPAGASVPLLAGWMALYAGATLALLGRGTWSLPLPPPRHPGVVGDEAGRQIALG